MDKELKIGIFRELDHEMSELVKSYALLYCLSPKDLLPWFSVMIVGQFSLTDYSEEFVKKSFDRMFERYKEKIKDQNPSNDPIHMRCCKCQNIDVVMTHNALTWRCPFCEINSVDKKI